MSSILPFFGTGSSVIRSGLTLYLDAGITTSYPGSGTTWSDISNNGGTGTLTNGPTFSSANGGSISFDGVDDLVSVANYSALNGLNQTMICWAKSASAANFGGTGCMMSKRDVYIMHPFATNTFIDYYYFLNGAYQYERITATNIDSWNMYASSWDGTTIKAYFNGNFVSANTRTGPLTTNDTGILSIGKDDFVSAGTNIKGNIAVCLQYNRALSNNEISQTFTTFRTRFGV